MEPIRPSAAILTLEDFRPKTEESKPKSEIFQGLLTRMPPVPGTLCDEARKHWYFIGERLAPVGLLCEVDLGQYQILCQTWALYVEAHRECELKGEWQTTSNGYHQLTPWAIARERHANRYQKVADKFFLSPRARKAVDLPNPNQGALNLDLS